MSQLLLDEVVQCIARARHKALHSISARAPRLAVYMTPDFYSDAMREINGPVDLITLEFYNSGTIWGYPVFLAEHVNGGARHAPWRVVNFDSVDSR